MCYDGTADVARPVNGLLRPPFELKLEISFSIEIDKLFQLFLVHECIRSLCLITRLLRERAFSMKFKA